MGGAKEFFFYSESQQKEFVEMKHHISLHQYSHFQTYNNHLKLRNSYDYAIGATLTQQGNLLAYHSETLFDTI